ncbi:hypothetical protein EDB19DRAFT_166101 [Suillus lakei]|nr:hypothetical protein EDB19DRAFT_166101 [Suillus lakei]
MAKPWPIFAPSRWKSMKTFVGNLGMPGIFGELMNARQGDVRRKYLADARTALRTMVVHGYSHKFSSPDDEDLIWYGDLRWCHSDGLMPSCEEFDWLIDYVVDEAGHKRDDETEGDALLALSAMRGLGSSTKRRSYVTSLIRCMGSTRPPRVRHVALRAASDARADLAAITIGSMPEGVDAGLLNDLSRALFTALCPNHDQAVYDAFFHYKRDCCYARLIFSLAMNDEWGERLTRDGHFERCTSLVEQALGHNDWELRCYLAGIFTCTDLPYNVLPLSPAQERLRTCVMTIWNQESPYASPGALPDLVAATRQHLQGDNNVPNDELSALARDVHGALESLQRTQSFFMSIGVATQADVNAALSSMQGLHDDLCCMIDNPKTSQRDDDPVSLGS